LRKSSKTTETFQVTSLEHSPVPKSGNVIDSNRRWLASTRHALIPFSMPCSAAMWKIYRHWSSPALVTATLQDVHSLSSTVNKEYSKNYKYKPASHLNLLTEQNHLTTFRWHIQHF